MGKHVFVILALLFSAPVFASVNWYNSSNTNLGVQTKAKCATGLTCAVASGKLVLTPTFAGQVQPRVAASTTQLTAAQCGSTVVNSATVVQKLPEASGAGNGCRFTFITGAATNFDVNPDDNDKILIETNSAGDAMRNATLGNSITVEVLSASEWAPVSVQGTWTDVN